MKRWTDLGIVLLCVALLVSACTPFGQSDLKDQFLTLTVMAPNEDGFKMNYLPVINAAFPRWEIRFEPLTPYLQQLNQAPEADEDAVIASVFAEKNPDLLILGNVHYRMMQSRNYLMSLDIPMSEDEVALDPVEPAMIDALRGTDGALYGLATHFSANVIYYNLDMFEQYGIPVPTGGMTWEEVFQLAERVPKESDLGEPMHGLFFDNMSDSIFNVVSQVLSAYGKSIRTAEDLETMTADSEYRYIWSYIMDAYRTGTVFQRNESGSPYTFFDEGRIAMIYGNETTIGRLSSDTRWSVVAQPYHPTSSGFSYDAIMSVSETSTQKEAAWEIVKLLNSNEQASRYTFGGLPISRSVAERLYEPHVIESFYQPPSLEDRGGTRITSELDRELSIKLFHEYNFIIKEMIEGNMTIDEAMERLRAVR